MHRAARYGDLETLKQRVELGESVENRDCNNYTPLHWAAQCGQIAVAKYLIKNNCDLNPICSRGHTPLLVAADNWKKSVVELLLQCGANVNCWSDDGFTILHYASVCGWGNIVQDIVNGGEVNINITNSDGRTALMLAAYRGFHNIADFLIQSGADVNISCTSKRTALHNAARGGSLETVQVILQKEGCVVNAQDNSGNTALHLACTCEIKEAEIVKLLLMAKATVNIKNNRNKTPLSKLLNRFDFEVCKLLFQHGAYLEHSDYENIISEKPDIKRLVLQNEEFCIQSIVNKFNHQSLPAVYGNAVLAKSLPRIDRLTIKRQHNVAREIEDFVKAEIQTKSFCIVTNARPTVLKLMCVQSLVNYLTTKKI